MVNSKQKQVKRTVDNFHIGLPRKTRKKKIK